MTLKELEQQLVALSPDEKLQPIHLLAQSLGNNWQGVKKTPRVCGGEARIAKTRIPVWVFMEARHLGYNDAEFCSLLRTRMSSCQT